MDILIAADIYRRYKENNEISMNIHPNDIMYRSGIEWYFSVGESAISGIMSALTLTRLSRVRRVLDLPCGHGRVARHLRAVFPESEMFYSDLDREGVDFCASQFGGTAIYSSPDLTQARLPHYLDVIWIGSLFTHLPIASTTRWLSFLSGHLSPQGILIATFHGYFTERNPPLNSRVDLDKLRRDFLESGYGFDAYKSDDEVQLSDYGFSLSKPSCIVDIADNIPQTRIISYTERGWASNHDVLVLCRDDRLRPFGG